MVEEEEKYKPFYRDNLANTFSKIKDEYGINSENKLDDLNYSGIESYYRKLLGHKDFSFVKIEYERLVVQLKKKGIKNVSWYSFWGGPRNIYQIAKNNNQVVLYDMFYKEYCHDVHGSRSFSKNLFSIDKNCTLFINDFRVPIDLNSAVYPSVYLSHLLFKEIFRKYLTNEKVLLNEVSQCILSFFSKLPKEDPIDFKNNRVQIFPE